MSLGRSFSKILYSFLNKFTPLSLCLKFSLILGGVSLLVLTTFESTLNGAEVPPKVVKSFTPEKILPQDLKYPTNIALLDDEFTHHVLVVEKSTHRLHLFSNNEGYPEYVQSYPIATGLTSGDKANSGDFKTPEGIYKLNSFLSREQLLENYGSDGKMYGIGAFVTNYPNLIDRKEGKTGGGIWLHSTNDESRLLKGLDSKGCVVLANDNLVDISKYIELNNTPIIIVQDLFFLRKESYEHNKQAIVDSFNNWILAWKTEDLRKYLNFYHPEFYDPTRGNLKKYSDYKKQVFANSGKPQIEASRLSVLLFENYALVQFKQSYKSSTIDDVGKKTLYLKRDSNYNWKIYFEDWEDYTKKNGSVTFTPSLRFFKG